MERNNPTKQKLRREKGIRKDINRVEIRITERK
jgi:hypothetical protein